MPVFESPALYIDFSRLPAPNVIEEIKFETILERYRADVVDKNPLLVNAVKLEQSPVNVILEPQAYGEVIVRARINAAAKALMLAFSTGSDLDHLGGLYNVKRLPIVDTPRPYLTNPEDWQSDDSFRSDIQGAPEAFSMGGTAGAYRFHAKQAVPTLRDASAMKIDDEAGVKVTLMNGGSNPAVSVEDILKVRTRLENPAIKPLTDVISVSSATVKEVKIVANITLYPGPDSGVILAEIQKALTALKDRISLLGRDLTRSAIITAINREGVLDVDLTSPAEDVTCKLDECASIKSASIKIRDERDE